MKFHNVCAAIFALACLVLASCSSNRTPLTYFENIDTSVSTPIEDYRVKVEPGDELLISVNSEYPDVTARYNVAQVNPATAKNSVLSGQPQNQTYTVDTQGDITMPVLGRVHVAGLNTDQIQKNLTERISQDVKNPLVKVTLVNFTVDVAGEVLRPGRIPVHADRYSILDAITEAGDLTPYGKRENVLLIREENGVRKSVRLNLNDAATLSSPYFFLKQNDYIYIEPSKVRKDNAEYNQNNSFKLSVVSTIVSGCSVIASLIIALTVK